jgi:DNA processing protein
MAADNGRQVFAAPGRIDPPRSKGCHDLIKNGAKLRESAGGPRRSGLAPSAVSVALLGLEMKRLIRQLAGKLFVKNT